MHPTWQHQCRGQVHYRMRATSLPASSASHARASCRLLQNHIAEAHGIHVWQVNLAKDWVNSDRTRAWAFLEVANEADGNHLITNIGLTRFDGAPLRIEWSHDILLGMTSGSAQITIDTYPNLIFYCTNIHGSAHSESLAGPTESTCPTTNGQPYHINDCTDGAHHHHNQLNKQ